MRNNEFKLKKSSSLTSDHDLEKLIHYQIIRIKILIISEWLNDKYTESISHQYIELFTKRYRIIWDF